MIELNEKTIKDKGLEYVNSLDTFTIWGNHYYPYPTILNDVKELFNVNIEYFGPSDQGSAKSTFTKKDSEEIIKEIMQKKIDTFANSNGVMITEWKFK